MVLMIKRIIEEETRGIDTYKLQYNKRNLELFEKILKKYKQNTRINYWNNYRR
jgi:hypothetical protein